MYSFGLFSIVSAVMITSGIGIFYQKSIMRAVIALSVSFIASSLIFFILNQEFIALLQLFVFVGGMSTYLIVAVSSEYKKINRIDFIKIGVAAIIISMSFSLLFTVINFNTANTAPGMSVYFATAFEEYYPIIIAAVIMLFLAAIGSVIVIRKFVTLIS